MVRALRLNTILLLLGTFIMSETLKYWYNEPPFWQETEDKIIVQTGAKTDFWRITHYGFIEDNGHFYYQEISGDFEMEVKITGQYQTLYDQGGLMVRESETVWLKCGIEFVEEVQNISAVITRDYSDWSVIPLSSPPASLWLKLKRQAESVEIKYSFNGQDYQLLRLGYLTPNTTVQAGLMCASPQGEGFLTTFEEFKIQIS